MNKTLKLAFGALLGAAMVVPAFAQSGEQFPDVPENHWVYQALLNMKNEGILVGYPDGMFRGGRPASRYELAGAINAAYQKLRGMIMGLQEQIDAIKGMPGGNPDEMAALRRELDALKAQVAAMSRYGDDIDALKRMTATFERDLAAMGVDVEAMKRDLADLAERVGALEKVKPAVDIHGDVNLVMHAGHRSSGLLGLTQDLRPTGLPGGGLRDLTFGHELALSVRGTKEEGPQWHGTVVIGNLVGALYGDQNSIIPSFPGGLAAGYTESTEEIYLHDLVVRFGTSLVGQGFGVEMGRIGHQAGSYFMERQDTTPYFENERWDNGNYYFDGVNLGFDWGAIDLNIYGGKPSNQTTVGGGSFRGMWAGLQVPAVTDAFTGRGEMLVDQMLGADVGIGLGTSGDIMLHYIFLDSNTTTVSGYNRVTVWGGEANFDLGGIALNGGYSQSDMGLNSTNVIDTDNSAWWAQAGFGFGTVEVNLGWRTIEPNFGAPGSWGREGIYWNPVNIEGFFGDVAFDLGNVDVKVGAYSYEPALGATINGIHEEYTGFNAELNFNIFSNWAAMLGWEHVKYDAAGGDYDLDWFRVGFGQDMGGDSSLMFKYEMSNLEVGGADVRKGGFFTTQWSKKF
jgi:hypothetical protein